MGGGRAEGGTEVKKRWVVDVYGYAISQCSPTSAGETPNTWPSVAVPGEGEGAPSSSKTGS